MKLCKRLFAPALGLICAASLHVLAEQVRVEKFALMVGINECRYVPKLEGCARS